MKPKTSYRLSLLLLLLVLLLPSESIQISGSSRAFNLKQSFDVVNDQAIIDSRSDEELERRMLIGTDDYPGTGANPHHDPKTPGTR